MRYGMSKPRKLEVIHYAARLIDIDENLDAFPREKECEKIGEAELIKFLRTV